MHIKALRTITTVCMMQAAVLEMTVSMKEADYEKTGTASRNCCGNAVALVDDHFAGSSNAPFLCAEHEYDDNAPQAGNIRSACSDSYPDPGAFDESESDCRIRLSDYDRIRCLAAFANTASQ